jgi:hypothetical protein
VLGGQVRGCPHLPLQSSAGREEGFQECMANTRNVFASIHLNAIIQRMPASLDQRHFGCFLLPVRLEECNDPVR